MSQPHRKVNGQFSATPVGEAESPDTPAEPLPPTAEEVEAAERRKAYHARIRAEQKTAMAATLAKPARHKYGSRF